MRDLTADARKTIKILCVHGVNHLETNPARSPSLNEQRWREAINGVSWDALIAEVGKRISAQSYLKNLQLVCPKVLRHDKIPWQQPGAKLKRHKTI